MVELCLSGPKGCHHLYLKRLGVFKGFEVGHLYLVDRFDGRAIQQVFGVELGMFRVFFLMRVIIVVVMIVMGVFVMRMFVFVFVLVLIMIMVVMAMFFFVIFPVQFSLGFDHFAAGCIGKNKERKRVRQKRDRVFDSFLVRIAFGRVLKADDIRTRCAQFHRDLVALNCDVQMSGSVDMRIRMACALSSDGQRDH